MSDDPLTAKHEDAEIDAEQARKAANLFDLRRMIGGLFVVYGVILFVLGLGASDAEIEKAAGWNLNLWVGVAMLLVGALFLAWAVLPARCRTRSSTTGRPTTIARSPARTPRPGRTRRP